MGKKTDKESKTKQKSTNKDKKKRDKKSRKKKSTVSPQQRLDMIATAAYYIAEKHGFDPQRATQDWKEAEQQIDAMLK
ncbi:MAG: DUF2934 domain-containing protein [Candidatus Thiodiazotropha sp. (ex Dulcina madagascariensis)]|nr:DUF2934 domain-containing protein [Candidatus Thiodiazotropha sp. (ex Epidulcina cf. delphinae)]MCU7921822.1 DUF2934 domain-containing protein [Candidatus Thiodiazotropha sp. (ex Dulcina madagascariensis)]MCU7927865.1 DUF2934 domain-containing protein [Candidatus Thiodiazotropha sp. (ex Dulcina madagascariensis)]